MNIKELAKSAINGAKEHSPIIFAGLGLVAAGVTVYTAIKEAPKAKLAITNATIKKEEEIRKELAPEKQNSEITVRLSAAEKIAIIFKCCWPAIVAAATTIGCTVASQICAGKKLKTARTAEELANKALSDYVASSIKKVGEKKTEEIKEDAAKTALGNNPPKRDKNGNIIAYGKGDYLFYDKQMNVYFWSSIDKIDRVQNDINAEILEGEFVTIDEFYERVAPDVELPSVASNLGFGAGVDEIAKNGFLKCYFTSEITDENEVRIVISYIARDRHTYKIYDPEV
jgi:hypothetical protein